MDNPHKTHFLVYKHFWGGTLFLFGLLTYLAFSYANNKHIDVGLKEEADGIAHYAQISKDSIEEYVIHISNEREEWASGKYVAILNRTGNLQFRSGNLAYSYMNLSSGQIKEILSGKTCFKTVKTSKGRLLRIITMPTVDSQQLIQIGIAVNKGSAPKSFCFLL